MPGVTIGDNVVIGCSSLVTKDIPSNCVAFGVPAKVYESIDEYRKKAATKSVPTKGLSYKKKKEFLENLYKL